MVSIYIEGAAWAALELLQKHEWAPIGHSGWMLCLECSGDGEEKLEHAEGCELAATIRDLKAALGA